MLLVSATPFHIAAIPTTPRLHRHCLCSEPHDMSARYARPDAVMYACAASSRLCAGAPNGIGAKPTSKLLIELSRASGAWPRCGEVSALGRAAMLGERVSNVAVRASACCGGFSRAADMSETSNVALRACLPGAATWPRRDSIERSTSRARASASTAFTACGFTGSAPAHNQHCSCRSCGHIIARDTDRSDCNACACQHSR